MVQKIWNDPCSDSCFAGLEEELETEGHLVRDTSFRPSLYCDLPYSALEKKTS